MGAGWGLPSPADSHDFSLQGSSRRARPQGPDRREGGTGKRERGPAGGRRWIRRPGDTEGGPAGMAAAWKMGGGFLLKLSAPDPSDWGSSHPLQDQRRLISMCSHSLERADSPALGFRQHPGVGVGLFSLPPPAAFSGPLHTLLPPPRLRPPCPGPLPLAQLPGSWPAGSCPSAPALQWWSQPRKPGPLGTGPRWWLSWGGWVCLLNWQHPGYGYSFCPGRGVRDVSLSL